MAFINHNKDRIGDTIILTENKSHVYGTFNVGHEMTVIGRGDRGYDLRDNDGNDLLEVGWDLDSFSKPKIRRQT
jgi:hypothetical protein